MHGAAGISPGSGKGCPLRGLQILKSEVTVFTASWLYNPGLPPIAGGGLAVSEGLIVETGSACDLVARYGPPAAEFPGCTIIPGFVNAHTHLALTDFPDWSRRAGIEPEPAPFTYRIRQMLKVRRQVSLDETIASLMRGLELCLASGTTSVGDIVTSPEMLPAFNGTMLSGRLYLELIGQDVSQFSARLDASLKGATAIHSPLSSGLSPHAPYTLNSSLLPDIASAAAKGALPLLIHLAESMAEVEFLERSSGSIAGLYKMAGWDSFIPPPRGITPVEFFDKGGLLGPDTLAVHCVQLTEAGASVLKERGVKICLCPRSNRYLDVGVAPVAMFKKMGIPLCIGTDSLASNNTLSLWDEIRFALDEYGGELSPEEQIGRAHV